MVEQAVKVSSQETFKINQDKKPQPGTKMAKIVSALQDGDSKEKREELCRDLVMLPQVLVARISEAKSRRYILDEKHSWQKKRKEEGAWYRIKDFVEWGMNKKEIKIAARIEHEINLTESRIRHVISKKRTKLGRKPTPEESRDAMSDGKLKDDIEREINVRKWLSTRDLLVQKGFMPMPKGRFEWKKAIKKYDELMGEEKKDVKTSPALVESQEAVIAETVIPTVSDSGKEDRKGFFRYLQDGNRWREPISFEGGVIFDSSKDHLKRRMIAEQNKRRQEEEKRTARLVGRR